MIKMENKILVLIDSPEHAEAALIQAKRHQRAHQAELHIVAFAYEATPNIHYGLPLEYPDFIKDKKCQAVKEQLDVVLQRVLPDVPYCEEVIWHEYPDQWLEEIYPQTPYSLVIKARHIDETCQSSQLDWQLIRLCPCPLYLAADNKWRSNKNVLAALDLASDKRAKQQLNESIIEQARCYAEFNGGQEYACYTVHVSPFLRDLGLVFSDEQEIHALDNLPAPQQALLNKYDLKSRLKIRAGLAEQVIPSLAAECHADLVVIGSVGRKGIKGRIIGNTAEKILHLLKTDVLILSPNED